MILLFAASALAAVDPQCDRLLRPADEIQSRSFELLDEVAATILAHPELGRLEVGGHTDNVGGEPHNLDLSQRRASAVVAWLVSRGVPAARLEAKGYGSSKPIASNDTAAGRDQNRRVEFDVLGP